MNKDEALARFSVSRQALLVTIARLSEFEIIGFPVEGTWSVKDLLGHLAAWERTLIEPLSVFAAGGAFTPEIITNHDAWNKEQSEKRIAASLAQIKEELEFVRREILASSAGLSDSQWEMVFQAPWGEQNSLSEMISGLAWHEEEHTKSIQKFLEYKKNDPSLPTQ
jgi:uncharacterized damage-inducible protein DinB